MTGFCVQCGTALIAGRSCSCCPSGGGSGELLVPFPKSDTPRRLLGSGIEFFAYVILGGIFGVLDFLSLGLLGILSLVLGALIVLRDCNAGAFNIAKRVTRMRVVDLRTGQPSSNLRGLVRNVYYLALALLAVILPPGLDILPWVLFLLFIGLDVMMIVASPKGRRLGDVLAGTQVIQERS